MTPDDTDSAHSTTAPEPWWIGEGTESCGFCLQGYVLETETRCVACDGPGCMHCMVRVKGAGCLQLFCPRCREEG